MVLEKNKGEAERLQDAIKIYSEHLSRHSLVPPQLALLIFVVCEHCVTQEATPAPGLAAFPSPRNFFFFNPYLRILISLTSRKSVREAGGRKGEREKKTSM